MIYYLLALDFVQFVLIISVARSVNRLATNQTTFAKILTEIRSQR